MKHLKVFESIDKVICDNCNWEWKTEKEDDRKYLCHKCGYDNELKTFDMKSLEEWKKTQSLPFTESKITNNTYIRKFSQSSKSDEFVWHRDKESRIIESIGKTDWLIQMDDELPKSIEGSVFIPMGVYHRLIKGSGDLKIKLTKL